MRPMGERVARKHRWVSEEAWKTAIDKKAEMIRLKQRSEGQKELPEEIPISRQAQAGETGDET